MIALDTNVLVRFLVRDDQRQARRARVLIEGAASAGDGCLHDPVLCELEWVLEAHQTRRCSNGASRPAQGAHGLGRMRYHPPTSCVLGSSSLPS